MLWNSTTEDAKQRAVSMVAGDTNVRARGHLQIHGDHHNGCGHHITTLLLSMAPSNALCTHSFMRIYMDRIETMLGTAAD